MHVNFKRDSNCHHTLLILNVFLSFFQYYALFQGLFAKNEKKMNNDTDPYCD